MKGDKNMNIQSVKKSRKEGYTIIPIKLVINPNIEDEGVTIILNGNPKASQSLLKNLEQAMINDKEIHYTSSKGKLFTVKIKYVAQYCDEACDNPRHAVSF